MTRPTHDPRLLRAALLCLGIALAVLAVAAMSSACEPARAQDPDAAECVCPEPPPCPPEGWELVALPVGDEGDALEAAQQALEQAEQALTGAKVAPAP